MQVKELGKQILDRIDPAYRLIYRVIHNEKYPIPSLINRSRVGSAGISRFLEAGHNIKEALNSEIRSYFKDEFLPSPFYMLDYGCGVGRVLIPFLKEYDFPIYCTDVDASSISFLQKNLPRCIPSCNLFEPPLPYPNNFFHCIYSVSIWTHLSIDKQIIWLQELQRVARDGALILITTSGFAALAKRRKKDYGWSDVSDKLLQESGIIYKQYTTFSENSSLYPGICSSYGLAAHSPLYIRENWSKFFEVLDIKEACIDGIQDLVIMRKR